MNYSKDNENVIIIKVWWKGEIEKMENMEIRIEWAKKYVQPIGNLVVAALEDAETNGEKMFAAKLANVFNEIGVADRKED